SSTAPFTQCTIANNYAFAAGGGAYLRQSSHLLTSTIVAGNAAGMDPATGDIGGVNAQLTGNNNLIRASTLTVPADTINADPKLGPLQRNGGPTFTMALLFGSPAIDKGSNNSINSSFDQRGPGFARTSGAATDIGAFESQDFVFQNGFETPP